MLNSIRRISPWSSARAGLKRIVDNSPTEFEEEHSDVNGGANCRGVKKANDTVKPVNKNNIVFMLPIRGIIFVGGTSSQNDLPDKAPSPGLSSYSRYSALFIDVHVQSADQSCILKIFASCMLDLRLLVSVQFTEKGLSPQEWSNRAVSVEHDAMQ